MLDPELEAQYRGQQRVVPVPSLSERADEGIRPGEIRQDACFRLVIGQLADELVDMSVRPWRLMSQTYVAFFGGVIASTVIAFLNARRLGVEAARRRLILLVGAGGLVAVIAVFAR